MDDSPPCSSGGFPGGSNGKNLPAIQWTGAQSLGREDTLEKEMATCSSILAWRILCTEETNGLQSMGLQKSQTRLSNQHLHAPLSMEFSRQEFWNGLPFPIPGDLPNPGIKSVSLAGWFFTTDTTWEASVEDETLNLD